MSKGNNVRDMLPKLPPVDFTMMKRPARVRPTVTRGNLVILSIATAKGTKRTTHGRNSGTVCGMLSSVT